MLGLGGGVQVALLVSEWTGLKRQASHCSNLHGKCSCFFFFWSRRQSKNFQKQVFLLQQRISWRFYFRLSPKGQRISGGLCGLETRLPCKSFEGCGGRQENRNNIHRKKNCRGKQSLMVLEFWLIHFFLFIFWQLLMFSCLGQSNGDRCPFLPQVNRGPL